MIVVIATRNMFIGAWGSIERKDGLGIQQKFSAEIHFIKPAERRLIFEEPYFHAKT